MALGSQLLFSLLLLLLGFGLHHRQRVYAQRVTCFKTDSKSGNSPSKYLQYDRNCQGSYPHVTIWSRRDGSGMEYQDLEVGADGGSRTGNPNVIAHEQCQTLVNKYADCLQTETFARYFMEPTMQPQRSLRKQDFNPIRRLLKRCASEVESEWKEKGMPDHFALVSGKDGKVIKHFGMSEISLPQYDCDPSLWLEVRKPVAPENAVEIKIAGMPNFILITFGDSGSKLSSLDCPQCSGYNIAVKEFATASDDSNCYPAFDAIYIYGPKVSQQANRGPICHPKPHFVDIDKGYFPNPNAPAGAPGAPGGGTGTGADPNAAGNVPPALADAASLPGLALVPFLLHRLL